VTSAVINSIRNPTIATLPAYSLSKGAGFLAIEHIANVTTPDKVQVITFHPGNLYSDGWKGIGITRDMLPFDDGNVAHDCCSANTKHADILS
jgi:hypothetical protein